MHVKWTKRCNKLGIIISWAGGVDLSTSLLGQTCKVKKGCNKLGIIISPIFFSRYFVWEGFQGHLHAKFYVTIIYILLLSGKVEEKVTISNLCNLYFLYFLLLFVLFWGGGFQETLACKVLCDNKIISTSMGRMCT